MSLQTVLAEIEPVWLQGTGEQRIPDDLMRIARGSALGERILARWLMADGGGALLAPNPQREVGLAAVQWPRQRLQKLIRDVGVLASAPAIRAEVGRNAVRKLKAALGNSYLLALDRTIWDGEGVNRAAAIKSAERLSAALQQDDPSTFDRLYAFLDWQGRCELRHWGAQHNTGFGQWVTLLHAQEAEMLAILPADQVKLLYEHHSDTTRASQ